MKTSVFVEYLGNQVEDKALISKVKELWVADGNKIKDIKDKKKIQNSINEFYNDNYFAKLDNVIKEIY